MMKTAMTMLVLLLAAGCSTTTQTNQPEPLDWRTLDRIRDAEVDYEASRRGAMALTGEDTRLRIDATLLDLDARIADKWLAIESASDISPRRFDSAMGEKAAAASELDGLGEVLARPSWFVKPGEKYPLRWSRNEHYLADLTEASNGKLSPILQSVTERFAGTLVIKHVAGSYQLELEFDVVHLLRPIIEFRAGSGPGGHRDVRVPEVVGYRRLAVETLDPGQTAAFLLSRATHHGEIRQRILFLRLVDARKE